MFSALGDLVAPPRESDEEEVLRQFGIYQCLPVGDGEPDFEAGEPTTAEEYLRRVR